MAGNGSRWAPAQAPEGRAALEAFDEWRRLPANAALTWDETLARYRNLVVVEAAHREASGADWEFEWNELLRIFEGFTILKYEEVMGAYDWAPGKPLRMVRLVAQKPG